MSNKGNIIKIMPMSTYSKYLSTADQARLRMLEVKVSLGRAGYDTKNYKEILLAVLRLYPELNTIEGGRKLRANWYLLNGELEYVGYFESLVSEVQGSLGNKVQNIGNLNGVVQS
tara:strand:- start:11501 stop:11845 length:345 start_codon:yes stop_codon:yes gene_type:complete